MFSIEEYKEAVSFLACSHRNFNIKNEGNDYARVILTNIFFNATKSIRMAANTLRNSIVDSSEYLDSLDSFLGRSGATLQIIVHHLPDNARENSNSNIYRRLCLNPAYDEGRIKVKSADGRNRFFLGERPINFCVADSLMFRMEDDVEKRTALCNFGNESKAKELELAFDTIFEEIPSIINLKELFA